MRQTTYVLLVALCGLITIAIALFVEDDGWRRLGYLPIIGALYFVYD